MEMSKAKMENRPLPKRFYLEALAAPCDGGWAIFLDGKPVKTPAKNPLMLRSKTVADAIAAEWRAQQQVIDTHRMPLTRLASIALDRVPLDRAALLTDIARYGETDLLCYLAPQSEALGRAQRAAFLPILAWAEQAHALAFVTTEGLMPIAQPDATLQTLQAIFAQADDHVLAALAMATPLFGSALLMLALWKQQITLEQALHAARLDEAYYEAQWGRDEEAHASWLAKSSDLTACHFYLVNTVQ